MADFFAVRNSSNCRNLPRNVLKLNTCHIKIKQDKKLEIRESFFFSGSIQIEVENASYIEQNLRNGVGALDFSFALLYSSGFLIHCLSVCTF